MVEIRERKSNYGLLVAVLLIIIMVLISYIAYDKGLEKNQEYPTSSTTETTTKISEEKITKSFTFKDLCQEEKKCNKSILETKDLKIKLESIEENGSIMHNLIFSGQVNKTISLNNFVSLDIINSEFYLIEESTIKEEINKVTLYDNKLINLDIIEINNLLDKSIKDMELTYYTYDQTCKNENKKYFIKNIVNLTEDGFYIIDSIKGPLKDNGFTC